MNPDFAFGLYVFCMDFHTGQWSRLYRIGSRLRVRLSDSAIKAIQGNRHDKESIGQGAWDEWEQARIYYRQLKRSKYAKDTK